MDHAILQNTGFLKPNPYVEIVVDGKSARKTYTLKNTNHPRWDQELTILATPSSVLQFRVLDHSSFRKDTLLGEKTVHVAEVLKMRDAANENYILFMYLNKASASGDASPEGSAGRGASEMFVVIKGLSRMEQQIEAVNGNVSSSAVTVTNGDAVRMRSRMSGVAEEPPTEGASSGFNANHAASTATSSGGAIKRNSGLNWNGGEAPNGGGGGGEPNLQTQRVTAVQVRDQVVVVDLSCGEPSE